MPESNYKPNSHRSREEAASSTSHEKKQAVVKTSAKTKKRSGLSRLADSFVTEDASSVGSYIITDVIIPKAKELLSAIIKQGLDMWLYGESRSTPSDRSRVSYNKYYKEKDRPLGGSSQRNRLGLDYEDPILETFGDAQAVLESMYDYAEEAGAVSIMDMYEFAGIPSDNYMLNHYGWTRLTLKSAKINRTSNGFYILKLPRAMLLE